jgi:hypothetical protein
MPRTASGSEVLEQARQALREAKTVEELHQAQAVVLPLLLDINAGDFSALPQSVTGVGWPT